MELGDDPGRDDARLIRNVLLRHFAKLSLGEGKSLAGAMRMYLWFLASKGDLPAGPNRRRSDGSGLPPLDAAPLSYSRRSTA